jgi:hypothetical protein
VHASLTHSLKLLGTVRLDHANDFGRDHEALVCPANKRADDVPTERDLDFFLRLHPKIQREMARGDVHNQVLQTSQQTD